MLPYFLLINDKNRLFCFKIKQTDDHIYKNVQKKIMFFAKKVFVFYFCNTLNSFT